jgi:maltokinase
VAVIDLTHALRDFDTARLERARWFAGKGRGIAALHVVDAMPVPGLNEAYLLIVDVSYADEQPGDRYALAAYLSAAGHVWEPEAGEGFWTAIAEALRDGATVRGIDGTFEMRPARSLGGEPLSGERILGVDQSNTSIILGERHVLKLYRRLEPGEHPEVELGLALTAAGFPHIPEVCGSIHHIDAAGRDTALAIVQRFVADAEDPWEGLTGRLVRRIAGHDAPDLEASTDEVAEIGAIAAALHVTLARELGSRPGTADDARRWRTAAERQLDEALTIVDGEAGAELAAFAPRIRAGLAAFDSAAAPLLARTHGDLHWGQFLRSPAGVHVVDFEGEPTRSIAERRRPTSPLRDLACLVRSLDHVARTAELRSHGVKPAMDVDAWIARAEQRCTRAYAAGLGDSGIILDRDLLRAFELEKETYEFVYAARFLPSWLYAPRLGMRWLHRHG